MQRERIFDKSGSPQLQMVIPRVGTWEPRRKGLPDLVVLTSQVCPLRGKLGIERSPYGPENSCEPRQGFVDVTPQTGPTEVTLAWASSAEE